MHVTVKLRMHAADEQFVHASLKTQEMAPHPLEVVRFVDLRHVGDRVSHAGASNLDQMHNGTDGGVQQEAAIM
jgi:hypothetical protein